MAAMKNLCVVFTTILFIAPTSQSAASKIQQTSTTSDDPFTLTSSTVTPLTHFDANTVTHSSPKVPTTKSPGNSRCNQDLQAVISHVSSNKPENVWAKQFFDSWGKPPAGIFQLTHIWPGSYSECIGLKPSYALNNKTYSFKGAFKYAILNMSYFLPLPPSLKKYDLLYYGFCFPDSCKAADFKTEFHKVISLLPLSKLYKYVLGLIVGYGKYMDRPMPGHIDWDWRGIFGVSFFSVFCSIIALGTLCDIYMRYRKQKEDVNTSHGVYSLRQQDDHNQTEDMNQGSAVSLNAEGDKFNSSDIQNIQPTLLVLSKRSRMTELCGDILMSFSALKNGEKILNTGGTNEKNISCIHGIRFLSMSWVILGHTYFFSAEYQSKVSTVSELIDNVPFQAISVGGPFSVDTFFLLSGTLVSYLFYNYLSSVESLKKIGWVKFYVHRFWRLTPAYMLILFLYVTLFRYVGSGPFWLPNGPQPSFCKDTWWTNLLYINNFVHDHEMCMGWTWYLANDMQFYVITPLILVPLALFKFAGFAVILILLVTSWGVSAYLTIHYKFVSPAATSSPYYMTEFYMRPYVRIGPYLIGIILGYILSKTKFKLEINKIFVVLGWALATALNLSLVYGLYHVNPSEDTWKSYMVLSRTAWAIGVAWVIFACVHGYGGFVNTILSWKALVPLSRLTYCAYLIHPAVMYYFYQTRRTLVDPIHTTMVSYFLCFMVASYAISFLLSISFESPMMNLEKVVLQKKNK